MVWSFEIDEKRLHILLEKFPKKLTQSMRPAMQKAMKWFKKKFTIARLRGRPGLKRRTGDLIRSFVVGVSDRGGGVSDMKAWMASRSKYAAIHETGGTIKSKRPGGFLAIPTKHALTPGGALQGRFAGPLRSVKGLFVEKGVGGGLFLWGEKGNFAVPFFVLKKEVTIKARLGLFKMFGKRAKIFVARFFNPAIDKAWRSGHQSK